MAAIMVSVGVLDRDDEVRTDSHVQQARSEGAAEGAQLRQEPIANGGPAAMDASNGAGPR
jgi:hypothetical protein